MLSTARPPSRSTDSTQASQTYQFRLSALHAALGSVALGLVTFVGVFLQADAVAVALVYLFVVVLISLRTGLVAALVVSVIAILCLDYFFSPPLFNLGIGEIDAVAVIVFGTTAFVVTHLMSRVRKSVEMLREQASLLDLTHDTVFVRDMNDVITYWNRGAEELYGWTKDQAVGKISHELLHTMFPMPVEGITAALIRTGRWEGELVHARRDGTHVTVASRWSLRQDEKGRPLGTLETNNNITERKAMEESLRQSEAYLHEAQKLGHTGSWARKVSSGTLFASPELVRIFGRDPDDDTPTQEMFLGSIHPDDRPFVEDAARKAIGGKADFEADHRIVLPDGSTKYVHSVAHPLVDDTGDLVEYVGTIMDVTERTRAGEALRQQANLLDQTHDAICVWEFPGTIVFWNRGAEQLYGYSRREAIGHSSHELLQTEHPLSTPVFEQVLEREGEWTGELMHTTRDGRKILVESRHVLVREGDGRRLVLETNRDITDRKHAEEAVRKAQAELAHVARVTTLGEMAASIAHEVDQPLSGVVINANACLRFLTGTSPNLDEVRDGLQAIARDGRRASDVIARIRSLARRTATEKEMLDIDEVVRDVVALVESEARRSRATLRTELAGNLPCVLGDRVLLQQVTLNLLLNGLEAMHAVVGRPKELVISTQREGDDRVHVAVQDSGSGIDPKLANRIFEPFHTTKSGGMGMGLSISRSIVEQHGGRLWTVPNDGPGTTFHFTV